MGGALQGFGTPSVYPTPQLPWAFTPQLSGQIGGPFGSSVPQQVQSFSFVPQQLQQLQAAVHQLLQTGYVQQQQIQQLLHIVPQQLQQIQHVIQFVAQQANQPSPMFGPQLFPPNAGYSLSTFGTPSGWLAAPPATQSQFYTQGGFGGQTGYVM